MAKQPHEAIPFVALASIKCSFHKETVVSTEPPKINSLVWLLQCYRPVALEELRVRYSAQAWLLKPGTTLGGDAKRGNQYLIHTALEGLITVKTHNQPNKQRLRERLKKAQKLRLIGQLLSAVTSIGIITALTNISGINCFIFFLL